MRPLRRGIQICKQRTGVTTFQRLTFLFQELVRYAAGQDEPPCGCVPCSCGDVDVFGLLMEPFSQQTVETDEEHPQAGAFCPTCMFQSKQGLAGTCGTLEQATRVGFKFVQPSVLFFRKTQQSFLGSPNGHAPRDYHFEIRSEESSDRLGLRHGRESVPFVRLELPQSPAHYPHD